MYELPAKSRDSFKLPRSSDAFSSKFVPSNFCRPTTLSRRTAGLRRLPMVARPSWVAQCHGSSGSTPSGRLFLQAAYSFSAIEPHTSPASTSTESMGTKRCRTMNTG